MADTLRCYWSLMVSIKIMDREAQFFFFFFFQGKDSINISKRALEPRIGQMRYLGIYKGTRSCHGRYASRVWGTSHQGCYQGGSSET